MNNQSRAFTLIELLVVISIVAILIAILLPALAQARESSRKIECGVRMKQIGMVTISYVEDFKNWLPFQPSYWKYRVDDYVQNRSGMSQIFYCPNALAIPKNKFSTTNKAYAANFRINPVFSSLSGDNRYAWRLDELDLKKGPLNSLSWISEGRVIPEWGYTSGNYNIGDYARHMKKTQYNKLYHDGHVETRIK